jgi:hypothetical protein
MPQKHLASTAQERGLRTRNRPLSRCMCHDPAQSSIIVASRSAPYSGGTYARFDQNRFIASAVGKPSIFSASGFYLHSGAAWANQRAIGFVRDATLSHASTPENKPAAARNRDQWGSLGALCCVMKKGVFGAPALAQVSAHEPIPNPVTQTKKHSAIAFESRRRCGRDGPAVICDSVRRSSATSPCVSM